MSESSRGPGCVAGLVGKKEVLSQVTGPEAAAEKRERVTLILQNLQDLTTKWTQTIGAQGGTEASQD